LKISDPAARVIDHTSRFPSFRVVMNPGIPWTPVRGISCEKEDSLMKKSIRGVLFLALPLAILLWPAGAPGQDEEQGRKIYNEKCQFCHGIKGNGDGPAAASLNPRPADFNGPNVWQKYDEKKMIDIVRNGKGMMPAFDLKPAEIKAVLDYITRTYKPK
jgi:mono/diheme cytochrome c family protein